MIYSVRTKCYSVNQGRLREALAGQKNRTSGLGRNLTFQLGQINHLAKGSTLSHAKEMVRIISPLVIHCTFHSQNPHLVQYLTNFRHELSNSALCSELFRKV